MRTKILTVAIAMTALAIPATVTAAPSGPGPGNAPNAKSCQKNGWTQLVRSDGTAFTSEEQCTSYAAGGGVLQPKSAPSSFTITLEPYDPGAWVCLAKFEGSGLLPGSPINIVQTDPWSGTNETPGFGHVEDDGTYVLDTGVSPGVTVYLTGTTAAGETITSNTAACPSA